MPIEIRELIIKASIDQRGTEEEPTRSSDSESTNTEGIIADCVERVMEILRNQSER